ncbi:MAG: hypothetical protein KAG53_06495 [Endozoicomonadaceae bacterium]|nr:hypothetical protein [Endozoicomonadaceae bacterium]
MKNTCTRKQIMYNEAYNKKRKLDDERNSNPSIMKSIKCFIATRTLKNRTCEYRYWTDIIIDETRRMDYSASLLNNAVNSAVNAFKDSRNEVNNENIHLEKKIDVFRDTLKEREVKINEIKEKIQIHNRKKTVNSVEHCKLVFDLKTENSAKNQDEGFMKYCKDSIDNNNAELEKLKKKNQYFSCSNSQLYNLIHENDCEENAGL